MEKKPILIGGHTYGYYYPDDKSFSCSHGGWSSKIDLIDHETCNLHGVKHLQKFKFIDEIPEGYVR